MRTVQKRAAVLDLAALPRRQRLGQREHAAGGPRLHRRGVAAQPPVERGCESVTIDSIAKDRESRPLCVRSASAGTARTDQAHDQGRGADEHQVELRVHEAEFRAEQYGAADHPAPPAHPGRFRCLWRPRAGGRCAKYRPRRRRRPRKIRAAIISR